MYTVAEIFGGILITLGSIFLTLLAAFITAYIFGYGFTFGRVAAKRRLAITVVHEAKERIERPFKEAERRVHEEEVKVGREVKHDDRVVEHDIKKAEK